MPLKLPETMLLIRIGREPMGVNSTSFSAICCYFQPPSIMWCKPNDGRLILYFETIYLSVSKVVFSHVKNCFHEIAPGNNLITFFDICRRPFFMNASSIACFPMIQISHIVRVIVLFPIELVSFRLQFQRWTFRCVQSPFQFVYNINFLRVCSSKFIQYVDSFH